MTTRVRTAPGNPGTQPHGMPGAKTGVGTAIYTDSSVWFTIGQGIVNEVFYPFVDTACVRDMQLLVSSGEDFFSEEKRDTTSEARYLAEGVPAYHLSNTCNDNRYRVEKSILSDPARSVLFQQTEFVPLEEDLADYSAFVLLNPHVGNQGADNNAWLGDYKGEPMLFAQRGDSTLALACSSAWVKRSVGYVGTSDGWQDVKQHGKMTWTHQRAENGNVALTAQVDLAQTKGRFVIAVGFGRDQDEAGHRARAGLLQGFDAARQTYVRIWTDWQNSLHQIKPSKKHPHDLYHVSAAVMRTHESKEFPGAIIASLATPWGAAHGDNDLGYHLVWPRDMIETVGGLLAIGAHADARRILRYFATTQEADGHWSQNMFLDGKPNWTGIQLDETSFVVLLVELARREKALTRDDLARLWPMVRRAVRYLVGTGPVTPMDRWEEEQGYFASTMAVEIAALLVGADLAHAQGESGLASYLLETADAWNEAIDAMIYVTGTELARRAGVDGYYVRFAGPNQKMAASAAAGEVTLKNHPAGEGKIAYADVVSPDALLLVRFGLRAADDPRIVNTVRVIDMLLKVDTPFGPCWHRYNDDGYGEHADGSPFDGTGIGRAWPLLTGERGHYEVAAGNTRGAEKLVQAMEGFANECGLLPEQIWDSADIPERQLYLGRPSGSAMPLVWAHAEYVKLRRSIRDGRVFDAPTQTAKRYITGKTHSPFVCWRVNQPCRSLPAGKVLRLELTAPAVVHWSTDDWKSARDSPTRDTGLGIHLLDIPTGGHKQATRILFTFRWDQPEHWQGENYQVLIDPQGGQ